MKALGFIGKTIFTLGERADGKYHEDQGQVVSAVIVVAGCRPLPIDDGEKLVNLISTNAIENPVEEPEV